jgi:hypothetical protein
VMGDPPLRFISHVNNFNYHVFIWSAELILSRKATPRDCQQCVGQIAVRCHSMLEAPQLDGLRSCDISHITYHPNHTISW